MFTILTVWSSLSAISLAQCVLILVLTALFLWRQIMAPFKQYSNIPQVAPHWLLGNTSFGGESLKDTYINHYKALQGHRFGLFWTGNCPAIFLRDLDLMKKVQVGDFEHFTDLGLFTADYRDKIGNVFGLVDMLGEQWRKMKNMVTAPFSVPRLKKTVPAMNAAAEKLTDYLKANEKNEFVETAEFTRKYFLNLIASVVFGIDIDCYGDKESEFEKKANSLISIPRIIIMKVWPSLAILLKIKMLNPDSETFLLDLFKRIVRQRRNLRSEVKDVLGNLMEVAKDNPDMTEEMMSRTCLQFFTDGYETAAQAISVLIYHLTIHPEVQGLIQNEIDFAFENKIESEELRVKELNDMPYLDQVLLEGFRLGCSPFAARNCTKDWKIPGDNFVIPKGMRVFIPIVGLHYDSKYWKDPSKFDPERFSPKNRGKIDSASYQPFGFGPRICLGQNLIKLESKIMLIQLLRNFSLKPFGHMPEEMVWDAGVFIGAKSVKVKLVSRF